MINLEELTDNVHHIRFSTQHLMNVSLLRMQEYAEDDYFKGKIFTLSEFVQRYVDINKKFDYYETVRGIGFPAETLIPFIEGDFDPLSKEELRMVDILEDKKGYIIGTYRNKEIKHELAHGLFHTNESYRHKVLNIIRDLTTKERKPIEKFLRSVNYDRSVWDTEINSYLIERKFNTKQNKKLIKLFKQYK